MRQLGGDNEVLDSTQHAVSIQSWDDTVSVVSLGCR